MGCIHENDVLLLLSLLLPLIFSGIGIDSPNGAPIPEKPERKFKSLLPFRFIAKPKQSLLFSLLLLFLLLPLFLFPLLLSLVTLLL